MTRYGMTVRMAALLLAAVSTATAQEAGMFGNSPSRNMAAEASGLPAEWDVTTGMNVLWSQPVGSQAYGGPVVAGGRVYVGTNNEGRRDPTIEGDKGVVMAFAAVWASAFAADGKVYLGDEDGDIVVLRAGKELEEIGEYTLGAAVYSTPVVHDGVMYILTRNRLWALKEGAQGDPL